MLSISSSAAPLQVFALVALASDIFANKSLLMMEDFNYVMFVHDFNKLHNFLPCYILNCN